MFSCEICKNFKNAYFKEHRWTTASELWYLFSKLNKKLHGLKGTAYSGLFWNVWIGPFLDSFPISRKLGKCWISMILKSRNRIRISKNSSPRTRKYTILDARCYLDSVLWSQSSQSSPSVRSWISFLKTESLLFYYFVTFFSVIVHDDSWPHLVTDEARFLEKKLAYQIWARN